MNSAMSPFTDLYLGVLIGLRCFLTQHEFGGSVHSYSTLR